MNTAPYLSQSELARKLNLPDSVISGAVKTGKLQPDFIVGKTKAFSMDRIPAIVQTLAAQPSN